LKKTKDKTILVSQEDVDIAPSKASDSGNLYRNIKLKRTKKAKSVESQKDEDVTAAQTKESVNGFRNFKLKKTKDRTPLGSQEGVDITPAKANDSGNVYRSIQLKKTKKAKSAEPQKDAEVTPTRQKLKKAEMTEGTISMKPGKTKYASSLDSQKDEYSSPTKIEDNKKLLILISSYMSTLIQRTSQDRAFTIIKGMGIGPERMEVVDGSMPANKEKRNELFGVSGIRAKYPQFFLVDCNEEINFLADWEGFEAMNDSGTLKDTLVLA